MKKINNILKNFYFNNFSKNRKEEYFESNDFITDEIEKSLVDMKEAYDIPTEEIEKSVSSRRLLRESRKNNI
jgi:hypothetical protein